jgi:hypothetical protein
MLNTGWQFSCRNAIDRPIFLIKKWKHWWKSWATRPGLASASSDNDLARPQLVQKRTWMNVSKAADPPYQSLSQRWILLILAGLNQSTLHAWSSSIFNRSRHQLCTTETQTAQHASDETNWNDLVSVETEIVWKQLGSPKYGPIGQANYFKGERTVSQHCNKYAFVG